jgi:hypothetical protein
MGETDVGKKRGKGNGGKINGEERNG